MSFSDTFTVDDLHRAHRFREGIVLDRDQVRDLAEAIEDVERDVDYQAFERIAPVVATMPVKWRKALAAALDIEIDEFGHAS